MNRCEAGLCAKEATTEIRVWDRHNERDNAIQTFLCSADADKKLDWVAEHAENYIAESLPLIGAPS